MQNRICVRFRVRDRGGSSANRTLENEAAEFDWVSFKNLPNAEEFVRRAYFATVKRFIREISEHKNGTTKHSLLSMESVLARSLNFTRKEVEEWIDARDWTQQVFQIPHDEAIAILKKVLPKLTSPNAEPFTDTEREKLQLVISTVADVPTDAIADYLFIKLDQKPEEPDWLNLL